MIEDKINPADVREGDRVKLVMSPHNYDATGSELTGEVIDAPRESDREYLRDGERIMADFAVESDDGDVWQWEIDNGYVIGYHPELDRHTDIGRFKRFEEPDDS